MSSLTGSGAAVTTGAVGDRAEMVGPDGVALGLRVKPLSWEGVLNIVARVG